MTFALVMSARRLRPYFQAHTICVLTKYPLRRILYKPDTSRRLINWAVELGEFDIEYLPRTAIKRQALANFLAELSNFPKVEGMPKKDSWTICMDRSSTMDRSGARIVVTTPKGKELTYAIKLDFKPTNNEAELRPFWQASTSH